MSFGRESKPVPPGGVTNSAVWANLPGPSSEWTHLDKGQNESESHRRSVSASGLSLWCKSLNICCNKSVDSIWRYAIIYGPPSYFRIIHWITLLSPFPNPPPPSKMSQVGRVLDVGKQAHGIGWIWPLMLTAGNSQGEETEILRQWQRIVLESTWDLPAKKSASNPSSLKDHRSSNALWSHVLAAPSLNSVVSPFHPILPGE
jgi:hypothetical protein